MRVVSNTSPISNLAIIGRLDFLKLRYGSVLIPPGVAFELGRLSHLQAKEHIQHGLTEGWLEISDKPLGAITFPKRFSLDRGELEAIELAIETKADLLLMDERRGRIVARDQGIAVAGVLGELLHAKIVGRLQTVQPEIERLRAEAGFFIGAELERFLLSQVGE